jgi:hypothetical protein
VRQAWRPPIYSSSAATTAALERECAAAVVHRGGAEPPPHHWGRPTAAHRPSLVGPVVPPPVAVGAAGAVPRRHHPMSLSPGCGDPPSPLHHAASPPSVAGRRTVGAPPFPRQLSPPRCRAPSPSSSAPLPPPPCARGRGCGGGSWGHWPAVQLEEDAARAAPRPGLVPLLCLSLPLCPLTDGRLRIRLGGITRCTRDCTRKPPVAAIFFPIRDRIASPCRLSHCRRHSRERGCCCAPSQAAASTLVVKPSSLVSPPFQRWRHPLPVLVKLALDPSPRLLPFSCGHRCRCC